MYDCMSIISYTFSLIRTLDFWKRKWNSGLNVSIKRVRNSLRQWTNGHSHHRLVDGARLIACHYSDAIMSAMASQISRVTSVYSTICSGAYQRKHKKSASLACVRGIHWSCTDEFPHKGPVTRKMFPFDDVIVWRFAFISLSKDIPAWKKYVSFPGIDTVTSNYWSQDPANIDKLDAIDIRFVYVSIVALCSNVCPSVWRRGLSDDERRQKKCDISSGVAYYLGIRLLSWINWEYGMYK